MMNVYVLAIHTSTWAKRSATMAYRTSGVAPEKRRLRVSLDKRKLPLFLLVALLIFACIVRASTPTSQHVYERERVGKV